MVYNLVENEKYSCFRLDPGDHEDVIETTYCVYEKFTQEVIMSSPDKYRALEYYKFVAHYGGAFDGFTPSFMMIQIDWDKIENSVISNDEYEEPYLDDAEYAEYAEYA